MKLICSALIAIGFMFPVMSYASRPPKGNCIIETATNHQNDFVWRLYNVTQQECFNSVYNIGVICKTVIKTTVKWKAKH